MVEVELDTRSALETEQAAEALAGELRAGDVLLIAGELGTGKTTFVRGACRALGVRETVSSPSFTIGKVYQGRLPISHVDLFRLETLEGEDPALLADYLTPDSISFVEWPDAASSELEPERVAMRIRLSHMGGDRRTISIAGRTDLMARVKERLDTRRTG
jgi:tRNA threonylcarbamoyladenosine biosynthesis protein TsaE